MIDRTEVSIEGELLDSKRKVSLEVVEVFEDYNGDILIEDLLSNLIQTDDKIFDVAATAAIRCSYK